MVQAPAVDLVSQHILEIRLLVVLHLDESDVLPVVPPAEQLVGEAPSLRERVHDAWSERESNSGSNHALAPLQRAVRPPCTSLRSRTASPRAAGTPRGPDSAGTRRPDPWGIRRHGRGGGRERVNNPSRSSLSIARLHLQAAGLRVRRMAPVEGARTLARLVEMGAVLEHCVEPARHRNPGLLHQSRARVSGSSASRSRCSDAGPVLPAAGVRP